MALSTPNLKTYNLQDLIISFGINISIEGFGPSDFLTIRRVSDNFSSQLGLHGAVVPIMSKDHRAIATLSIMRESDNIASLSLTSALDQISGLGVFPFLVSYLNLTQLYSSVQARVIREPDSIFGEKNGYLTWTFELYRLIRFG